MTTLLNLRHVPPKDPLGDGISMVQPLWVAGDDLEVVNDARVSWDRESTWAKPLDEVSIKYAGYAEGGSPVLRHADSRLVSFLTSHNHWTPTGGSIMKLQIRMPIFVKREWDRSGVGFLRNEMSRRGVKTAPQLYLRPASGMRRAPVEGENRQGVQYAEPVASAEWIAQRRRELQEACVDQYQSEVNIYGVAPEVARDQLPQSMYTEFRETASLAAYLRICKLRIQPDVMLECRQYAEAVASIIEPLFPVTWAEGMRDRDLELRSLVRELLQLQEENEAMPSRLLEEMRALVVGR